MSKRTARRKKQKKQKTKKQPHARNRGSRESASPSGGESNASAAGAVHRADELILRHRYNDAAELLEDANRQYPQDESVKRQMVFVYYELGRFRPLCLICRELLRRRGDDVELHLMLVGGYMKSARFASALLAFREPDRRWPHDSDVEQMRDAIVEFEHVVLEMTRAMGIDDDDPVAVAAEHEELLTALAEEENEHAVEVGERLLAQHPHFLAAMNKLSEAYFRTGAANKATEMLQRVLTEEPENFFALANLTKQLFLLGRFDEAQQNADRLRAIDAPSSKSPRHVELWAKKAETLAFLGDDAGVLEALQQAETNKALTSRTPDTALLCHLAAVAYARNDEVKQARRYWKRALEIQPDLEAANENLLDLKRPVAKREGPFPFPLSAWTRRERMANLMQEMKPLEHENLDEVECEKAQGILEKYPEVMALIPALLDRGDEIGRDAALRTAMLAQTPALLAALKVFAFGKSGSDAMRMETAFTLTRIGFLEPGPAKVWLSGGWRDVELLGIEITDEPTGATHGDEVNDLHFEGMNAIRRGDGRTGERLFREALEIEPDAPDLRNNLASALSVQGRNAEALDILRKIHQEHPDYFFGILAMAQDCIYNGAFKTAEEYLKPLCAGRVLHRTEFAGLCNAYLQLYTGNGDFDALTRWRNTLEHVDPDNPALRIFTNHTTLHKNIHRAFEKLSRLVGRE